MSQINVDRLTTQPDGRSHQWPRYAPASTVNARRLTPAGCTTMDTERAARGPLTSAHTVGRVVSIVIVVLLAAADAATSNSVRLAGLQLANQTTAAWPACPNPEGQACLGAIAAGRYTTKLFQPQLTYTVPDGWSNFEDWPGGFLLVPPQNTLPGVNAGTSDFIGVATSAAPAEGCDFTVPEGVASTPEAFSKWLTGHAGVSASAQGAVSVAGLRGVVLDLRVASGWTDFCHFPMTTPVIPLMSGRKPSSFEHGLSPGQATRLYLLAYRQGVLEIELVDARDAKHLDRYSRIVERFIFKG